MGRGADGRSREEVRMIEASLRAWKAPAGRWSIMWKRGEGEVSDEAGWRPGPEGKGLARCAVEFQ